MIPPSLSDTVWLSMDAATSPGAQTGRRAGAGPVRRPAKWLAWRLLPLLRGIPLAPGRRTGRSRPRIDAEREVGAEQVVQVGGGEDLVALRDQGEAAGEGVRPLVVCRKGVGGRQHHAAVGVGRGEGHGAGVAGGNMAV